MRQEISHQLSAGLNDLRSLSDEISRHEASIVELQRFQSEAGSRLGKKSGDVAGLRSAIAEVKQEVSGLAKASEQQEFRLSEVESRVSVEARSSDAPRETASALAEPLASSLREAEARIHSRQQEFQQRLTAWQEELETNLTRELENVSAAGGDLKQCFEDFSTQQRRSFTELRVESRAAIRSEASNLVALDEQLWQCDERLARRIDELVATRQSQVAPERLSAPEAARAVDDGQEVQVASALVAELRSGKPPNQPRWSSLAEDGPESLARQVEERARKAGAAHSHSPARLRFKAQSVADK